MQQDGSGGQQLDRTSTPRSWMTGGKSDEGSARAAVVDMNVELNGAGPNLSEMLSREPMMARL